MKLSEINIRDPFILPFDGMYYMYSYAITSDNKNGFQYYTSTDLENWTEPEICFLQNDDFWSDREYWAPEVHKYNGKFYLFATFHSENRVRTVQILKADKPCGPFEVWSNPITPDDQMCLDGTLYVENGTPYMVYCHEWVQCTDGEMYLAELTNDLKNAKGKPSLLFKASKSGWAEKLGNEADSGIITDGPFIHKTSYGHLVMTWSSFKNDIYAVGVAVSQTGSIKGPWKHYSEPLLHNNSGHGMMFKSFDGEMIFAVHGPNYPPGEERAAFYRYIETEEFPYIRLEQINL